MTKPDPTQRAIKALEQALKSLNCDDWGELDMNGEGAMKPAAHDIVQFPQGCPVCQLRDAITLLRSQPAPPQRVDVEAVGTLRRDDNGDILFTPTTEFRVIDGMPVFISSPPKEVGSYAMLREVTVEQVMEVVDEYVPGKVMNDDLRSRLTSLFEEKAQEE